MQETKNYTSKLLKILTAKTHYRLNLEMVFLMF